MKKILSALFAIVLMFSYFPIKSEASSGMGDRLVAIAKQYNGVPYLFGGTTTKGFDCSGFTQFVYNQVGLSLPRTAADQYQKGVPVEVKNLQQGDLVFYSNTYKNGISHVGIYIGEQKFISATSSGVMEYRLDNSYWSPKYTGAKRLIATENAIQPAIPVNFSDIKSSHFAYFAIQSMTGSGIISGYDDGTFRPETAVTRGQAAAIINRALNYTPKTVQSFKDVPTSNRFAKDIAAMKELKIIGGFADGTFRPDATMTRAEMAVIVIRAFGVKKVSASSSEAAPVYTDLYKGYWAYDSIATLRSVDKTAGFKTATYRPTENATRADLSAAVFSSR